MPIKSLAEYSIFKDLPSMYLGTGLKALVCKAGLGLYRPGLSRNINPLLINPHNVLFPT